MSTTVHRFELECNPIQLPTDVAQCHLYVWEHQFTPEVVQQIAIKNGVEIPSQTSPKRMLEHLSIRIMLKQLLGPTANICYTPNGKPRLIHPAAAYEISISHTQGAFALSFSPRSHGIDLERISQRAYMLRNKFLTESEQAIDIFPQEHLPEENATALWCAKEAAFKAFSSEQLTLITQISLAFHRNRGLIASTNCKEKVSAPVSIYRMNNLMITVCESDKQAFV